jgi:rhomboid protease GluP
VSDPLGGLDPVAPEPPVRRPFLPATYGLLFALAAMFFAEMAVAGDFAGESDYALVRLGSLISGAIRDGDFWRIGSYAFLHIGWLHILTNGWSLWILMPQVELAFGSTLALGFFSATALLGGMTSFSWALLRGHEVFAAGASGGVFGLFGATISLLYRVRHRFSAEQQRSMRRQVVLNLLLNAFIAFRFPVDNAAHLGGLLSGVLLGLLAPQRSLSRHFWQRPTKWLLYASILVLGALEGAAIGRAVKPKPRLLRGPGVEAKIDPLFIPVGPGKAAFPGAAVLDIRREPVPFAIATNDTRLRVGGREWLRTAVSQSGAERVVLETPDGTGKLVVEMLCGEEFCHGERGASMLEPTLLSVRGMR